MAESRSDSDFASQTSPPSCLRALKKLKHVLSVSPPMLTLPKPRLTKEQLGDPSQTRKTSSRPLSRTGRDWVVRGSTFSQLENLSIDTIGTPSMGHRGVAQANL